MKKVENTTTLYHKIIGSNWNRKLIPKAHARVQFCSDPVRSHAYFPEWKPALSVISWIQVFMNNDKFLPVGIPVELISLHSNSYYDQIYP